MSEAISAGAGTVGLTLPCPVHSTPANRQAAAAIVPAARTAVQAAGPGHLVADLVVVCRDSSEERAVKAEWDCQVLLDEARADVVREPQILGEARLAGLTQDDLAAELDETSPRPVAVPPSPRPVRRRGGS